MTEFETWKSKRTPIKAELTRFKKTFNEHDRISGAGSLPSRLPYFEKLYERFDEIQSNNSTHFPGNIGKDERYP